MIHEGVRISTIGLFGMVALPYSLKVIWSPLLDRYKLPGFGRRRGWMIWTQAALIVAMGALAWQQPVHAVRLAAVALVITMLSATQDLAFDAYRTDILRGSEPGLGTAAAAIGFRSAVLVAGSMALILADHISWPAVLALMAIMMFGGLGGSTIGSEPLPAEQNPKRLVEAVGKPVVEFIDREGLRQTFWIVAFVMIYRIGEAVLGSMATPFLLRTGFTQSEVGTFQGGLGVMAVLAGSAVGGIVQSRIGINRALFVFGIFQAASNFGYVLLAHAGKNYSVMALAVITENFCYGLASVAFVSYLTTLCDPRFSATQFALLSSLAYLGATLSGAPAGILAERMGWIAFFWLSFWCAIPGLLLLRWMPAGQTKLDSEGRC
jgi:PAT family beta-lactamase induction signal transducer AmpG